jgi:hypothetical protein
MLGPAGWDSQPRRLGVAGHVVRIGWFAGQPNGLLTAICEDGERVDLVVVPPDTEATVAEEAMTLATQDANTVHAPDILAAVIGHRRLRTEAEPETVWESEGGRVQDGIRHPERDHGADQGGGAPGVDTKKKEQLGQLPNPGRQWRPKGDPVQVEDHSFFFTGPDVPHAIPYGVYDLAADRGWVNVGVDHDTSAFAVASIRRWWHARGRADHPGAYRLLITADCGGSNSYRYRAWKAELAGFAAET